MDIMAIHSPLALKDKSDHMGKRKRVHIVNEYLVMQWKCIRLLSSKRY